MSRSVSRRIARNALEKDTGNRSPHGRGRFRGLNPLQYAITSAAWARSERMQRGQT